MEEHLSLKEKEQAEEAMIQQAFQELLNDYLATKHRKRVEIITKAFNFANQAHRGIKRRSGEPYIMHPIAVAKIVCNEIGLGSTSICAALLHDVVEDTDYTVEDIENIFGHKIAQIVDGLTKISGGILPRLGTGGELQEAAAHHERRHPRHPYQDSRPSAQHAHAGLHAAQQAIQDCRRDALYLRSPGSPAGAEPHQDRAGKPQLQVRTPRRICRDREEAGRHGFKYEHPEEYAEIEKKLAATAAERDKVFQEFTAPIRAQLDKMGLQYHILARVKSIYSIWNKMQTKHVPFEEIYDILAVRIVFKPRNMEEELNDCFDIYVAISKIYKPHPDRLRDWVSHPKSNGYQALHVTLMANNGQWIEVQIRSERMDDVAEQGFAAHWKYKEGGGGEDEGELERWLHTIKEILDDPQPDAIDFLDTIKLNLFASEIFVFTPKGDLKTMPQDSTALDFAFSLHTDIGTHCIGAKVNHKLVPLSHRLNSGDQVEILTSKAQRIQPEWVGFVTTARAKAKITEILRKEEKINQQKGEVLLNEFLQKEGVPVDASSIDRLTNLHNFHTPDELMAAIGSGKVVLGDVDRNLFKEKQGKNWKKLLSFSFVKDTVKDGKDGKVVPKAEGKPEKIDTKKILKLTEEAISKEYIMAECCHPIPGDDVLGYIDEQNRVIIHKRQCPVAVKLKSSYGNRIIATQWDTHKDLSFLVTIYVRGIDGVGVLNEVTQVISRQLNVNIRKLNIDAIDGIFEGKIQLYVHDVDDVRTICNNLKQLQHIKEVARVED